MGNFWSYLGYIDEADETIETFDKGLDALFKLRKKFTFGTYVYKQSNQIYSSMVLLTSEEYSNIDRNDIYMNKYYEKCNNLLNTVFHMEQIGIARKVDKFIRNHIIMKKSTGNCAWEKLKHINTIYNPSHLIKFNENIIHDLLYMKSYYANYYNINTRKIITVHDMYIELGPICILCEIPELLG